MRKFLNRLSVAATCFLFSVSLTNFFQPILRYDSTTTLVVPDYVESNEDERQLRDLYREYAAAQTRNDRVFFDRIATPDFVLHWRGLRVNKTMILRDLEQPSPGLVYDCKVDHVRLLGDTAIVESRTEIHARDGSVYSRQYVDTWVKWLGMWQLQSTTLVNVPPY